MIIAVDGPTASGKGTIAKALAEHFALPVLDTGLLYRAVGYQTQLNHGDADKAAAYFDWAVSTATPSLDLPEQVDRHLLAPERRQEWIDKCGEVATPLLWSHAMVLRLAKELDR